MNIEKETYIKFQYISALTTAKRNSFQLTSNVKFVHYIKHVKMHIFYPNV